LKNGAQDMLFYIFERVAINQPLFKKFLKSFTALVSFPRQTRTDTFH